MIADYEVIYFAEIRCYWCGHDCGTVNSRGKPTTAIGVPLDYHGHGADPRSVRTIGEIRCSRCRGPVYAENHDKRREYQNFVFRQRRPRRPKVA